MKTLSQKLADEFQAELRKEEAIANIIATANIVAFTPQESPATPNNCEYLKKCKPEQVKCYRFPNECPVYKFYDKYKDFDCGRQLGI